VGRAMEGAVGGAMEGVSSISSRPGEMRSTCLISG